MNSKRILTVQDFSCVGQCSLTTALPIISACGTETACLPTALLSNHTTAFSEYTFKDLSREVAGIIAALENQNIKFDAFYIGYLGSERIISAIKPIFDVCAEKGALKIIDPAMADNGKLYPGLSEEYVKEIKELCKSADIILPNLTEACLLTDTEYTRTPSTDFLKGVAEKLCRICNTAVITGVEANKKIYNCICSGGKITYQKNKRIEKSFPGTGDVFAAAFTGLLLSGKSITSSVKTAAAFTYKSIKHTLHFPEHKYGVNFEKALPYLIKHT